MTLLFLAMWAFQKPEFMMVEPVETYFAGPTDFVFKTTVDEEDLLGIELFINGESVGYLDKPPFETNLDMRRFPEGTTQIRAVLTRFDGDDLSVELEGVNDPNFIETDVHLVRVPVYVEWAEGEKAFDVNQLRVFENGKEQAVSYRYGEESPLHLTVVLDLSGSMERRILMLRAGVLRLIETLRPGDGIEVVGFNHAVFPISQYETDLSLVKPRLNRLRADGYTNLYGAVWSGIKIVGNSKQRRALILFTDGYHELEGTEDYYKVDLEDCLDLAGEKGVPIYTMGLGNSVDREVLESLAKESGGKSFLLTGSDSVQAAFEEIGGKMSRQYLLCYYTKSRKHGWRDIDVRFSGEDAPATLRFPQKVFFKQSLK